MMQLNPARGVGVRRCGYRDRQLSAASRSPRTMDEDIAVFAGDAEVKEGKVSVTAPEIAENGNSVPIEISVESAMEGDDMVEEVIVLPMATRTPASRPSSSRAQR